MIGLASAVFFVVIGPAAPPPGALEFCGAPCAGIEAPGPEATFVSLASGAPASSQPARAALLDSHRAMLAEINRAVNRAIQRVSDARQYGREEFWTRPNSGRGDCEDIAIEKRARLIALGWPPGILSLVTAMTDDGLHTILVVHAKEGDIVLESEENALRRPDELQGYRWIAMQTGADLAHWRTIRLAR